MKIIGFESTERTYVYGLRAKGGRNFRYIGIARDLRLRIRQHEIKSHNIGVRKWIERLRLRGSEPEAVILAIVENDSYGLRTKGVLFADRVEAGIICQLSAWRKNGVAPPLFNLAVNPLLLLKNRKRGRRVSAKKSSGCRTRKEAVGRSERRGCPRDTQPRGKGAVEKTESEAATGNLP